MFSNKKKLDLVLDEYRELVAIFAAAIIQNNTYQFMREDRLKYERYDLVISEAKKYADAFLEKVD